MHALTLREALLPIHTRTIGAAWLEWAITFWNTSASVLFAPEAWAALTVGIARREAGLLQDCADVAVFALCISLAVWILGCLGIALDILVLAVEVTILKLTALRHIHRTVIGVEALWIAVTDVRFTRVAVFVGAVLRVDPLTAIHIGVAFAANDLLFAGFAFRYTEETVKAVVAGVCAWCTFFWNRTRLMARVAEWALIVMADLVAFWALHTAVVEDADALFEVTELFFAACIIGVAALSTFAVGKTDLTGF